METRPGIPQNKGNGLVFDRPRSKRDPVHREGSGVPQNGGNRPPTIETGVLFIGKGLAYCKTDETDLLQSKWGSCSSGRVWRTAKRSKRTCVGALRSKRGSCSSGGVWRTTKRGSTGYCSYPPSTPSSLHGLLFIHPSTGYCSSSPPPSTVHPALHGVVMFIQPSTGSCSSSPNRLDRGNATGSCSSTPPLTVHPTPP